MVSMNTPINDSTADYNSGNFNSPTKKEWCKPEISLINKDAIGKTFHATESNLISAGPS